MTGPTPEQAEHERVRFLAGVTESLAELLDTGEAADRLARLLVPRLADWATVTVMAGDGAPGRTSRAHRDPERLADADTYLAGRVAAPRDQAALTAVLRSGEPVQVGPVDLDLGPEALPEGPVRDAWRRLDPRSALLVPLQARGSAFGVLSLVCTGDRPPHTPAEVDLAREAGRRGALALHNTRLYSRQLRVAETLQHSLLTPPPESEGLQIAVRYRPAGSQALVGGDWYDAVAQPDGATLLVIGDVTGHGVEAAAAMAQLRSAVRTLAYDSPDSPARTLDRVDRVLSGLHTGTLATALVARLELPEADGTRTLRWSSAGHLPPLLVAPDAAVRVLSSRAERLLGTREPARRSDQETVLRPGETVLLVTDGLVEVGRQDVDTGMARLVDALRGLGGLSADALCDRLLTRVVPDGTDDDVAVLAVRLLPA
ncbi:Serine phosphatase RsbU, regulator of sigma subunit [Geodermatophilus dictyosporus]|uniref:Serine phosphatase RsbU, regulator of sigma subunit n=1 Tax=Geodermatophilus dictyosporus TaxID=1523247 RepID=A0A1I5T7I2_9ACTN|nr:GAF domain-containing SpoIIE family protein phosphatase [Geodermatophilus dictyosporus]SFP78928.1 Serine phosphatase RsbU, regulator of sigma subunit [Geodermatophilus dictyosporus]